MERSIAHKLRHSIVTLVCVSGVLVSAQAAPAAPSVAATVQTFPVAPAIVKRPVPPAPSSAGTPMRSVASRTGVLGPWQLGSRNWHHALDKNFRVTIGSAEVGTAVFAGSQHATLGGIHIRHSGLSLRDSDEDLTMSLAFGALDYSGKLVKSDLAYGPAAASTAFRYRPGKRLGLESGIQLAPGLLTSTLAGRYDARHWGELRAGIAHGSLGGQRGWRYLTSYDVPLMYRLRFSVRNEWNAPGFADLAHYSSGVSAGIRNELSAIFSAGRWGDIRGTYQSLRPADGLSTRRLGFSQQFWYSPNLRVDLRGQREVISGDYDVGIRFSVPIK